MGSGSGIAAGTFGLLALISGPLGWVSLGTALVGLGIKGYGHLCS